MKRTTPKIPACDYRRFDPFQNTPDWRLKIALQHQQRRTRPKGWEDPLIPELVRFLRHLHRGKTAAVSADLLLAHAIYAAGGPLRNEIEARLLAGQPDEIVSKKTMVPVPVLSAYEPAFFNVSDRLQAGDWIMLNAIRLTPGQPVTEGQVWKYLAVAGGPVILDIMVDDFHHRPTDDPALRANLAAKGRYIVRAVAVGWHSLPAMATILNEGRRLFAHLFRGSSREAQLLRLQHQSMRWMLASMHRTHLRTKLQTGQRIAQKDVSHASTDFEQPVLLQNKVAA